MKAGKSPRVDEQRTAIILAQIAAVAYAQDAGEKPEVCWAALQGVAMLQQAFDGDFGSALAGAEVGHARKAITTIRRATFFPSSG